jgi:predicted amidohydrolase
MQGETISWLVETAKSKNCAITGSFVISENGNYFNRLVFVFPSGEIKTYDKRHLFTLAGEEKVYTAGTFKLIIEYKGFKICTLVCYDLRFPVFSRNTENYDVLLYVANWPKIRSHAWNVLLQARAIENMSYVIGVNRVGFDANNHEYIGHSQVIDFLGNHIIHPQETEEIFYAEITKQELLETRKKLAFLNDQDEFTLKI